MGALHGLHKTRGVWKKTADEQGLIRGVEQSSVDAEMIAIIGRCMLMLPSTQRECRDSGQGYHRARQRLLRGLAAFSRRRGGWCIGPGWDGMR